MLVRVPPVVSHSKDNQVYWLLIQGSAEAENSSIRYTLMGSSIECNPIKLYIKDMQYINSCYITLIQ